jgi:hypothetical protein
MHFNSASFDDLDQHAVDQMVFETGGELITLRYITQDAAERAEPILRLFGHRGIRDCECTS